MTSSEWISTGIAVPLVSFVVWVLKRLLVQQQEIVDKYLAAMESQAVVLAAVANSLINMHSDHTKQIELLQHMAKAVDKAVNDHPGDKP